MVATKRRFNPNLQRVRVLLKGKATRAYVCTRCLKGGKVTKADHAQLLPGRACCGLIDVASDRRANGDARAPRARGALRSSLERNRRRIDDLNVYPGPRRRHRHESHADGPRRGRAAATRRRRATVATLASELTRAALMGARGNSGVIFSQIVRGFAEVVADAEQFDAPTLARAFRGASDAAYAR